MMYLRFIDGAWLNLVLLYSDTKWDYPSRMQQTLLCVSCQVAYYHYILMPNIFQEVATSLTVPIWSVMYFFLHYSYWNNSKYGDSMVTYFKFIKNLHFLLLLTIKCVWFVGFSKFYQESISQHLKFTWIFHCQIPRKFSKF